MCFTRKNPNGFDVERFRQRVYVQISIYVFAAEKVVCERFVQQKVRFRHIVREIK